MESKCRKNNFVIEYFCEMKTKCFDREYYFINKNSCLYTGKPCPFFKSEVTLSTIHKIINVLDDNFSEWTIEDVTIKDDEIIVYGDIGRYENFRFTFDRYGNMKNKIIYD